MNSLTLRDIRKSYGTSEVLKGIDLSVESGNVVALFGENGSGKSTLLRIISMLAKPSSGTVEICGLDTQKSGETARLHLGAVMHSPMLYRDLTARENLRLFAKMCRLDDLENRVEHVASRLGFTSRLDARIRSLSHGYQKRVSIARSVIHSPELLLLDEPETGLDERGLRILKELILEWRDSGNTVIMSTHTVAMGEQMADTSFRLKDGRLQRLT